MKVPVSLQSVCKMAEETVLLDSRATANLMDHRTMQRLGFLAFPLPQPRPIINVDGTINKCRSIKYSLDLHVTVGTTIHLETFFITDLG